MRALLLTLVLAGTAHAQWDLQTSGTTASLRGIHSLGNGIAWASGSEGTVLRTTDGGKTWQHCATPPDAEKLDFRGVQAFDADTAIVMSSGKGDLSRLYKTTDGCTTWKLVFTNPDSDGFFDAVSFQSSMQSSGRFPNFDHIAGELLGDPVDGEFALFITDDGGNTWTRRAAQKHDRSHECKIDKFTVLPGESAFAASNQALVYDNYVSDRRYPNFRFSLPYFITGGSQSRIAYTETVRMFDDVVCSDTSAFLKLPLGGSQSSGAFASAPKTSKGLGTGSMMIVGGDYLHPEVTLGTAVYVWLNSLPMTWLNVRRPHTPPHGYRSAVAYDPATKTWITVGPNGTDVSTDDGRNWRAVGPLAGEAADADQHWNALSLPFVVGAHGRIGVLNPEALKKP